MLRVNLFGVNFYTLELLIIPIILIALLMRLHQDKKILLSSHTSKKLLITFWGSCFLFLIFILLSSTFAINKANVLKGFLKWGEIFSIATIVFLYSSNPNRFKKAWLLLLFSHVLILTFTTFNSFERLSQGYFDLEGLRKISSHASIFAAALILPLALKKRAWLFLFALFSLLSFFSFSRGAWLVIFILITFFFIKRNSFNFRKLKLVYPIIALSVIIFSLLLNETVRELAFFRIETAFSMKLPSNKERVGMLLSTAKAFNSSPIVGIGSENFADYLLRTGIPDFVSAHEPEKLTPHNLLAQVTAETGLLGVFSLLILLITVYNAMKLKNRTKNNELNPLIDGLQVYFFVLMLHFLTAFIASEFRFSIGVYFGLSIASLRQLKTS